MRELSEDTKKALLTNLLIMIEGVADKEYQKRVWIRGEGPECNDFDETVCSFFDFGEPIFKYYKQFNFSDHQYEVLMKFRDEFDTFASQHYHPKEFIDDPEWDRIMKMAGEVLKAFA